MDNNKPLRDYYPEIEPYKTGKLKVSDIHEIYYEEVGNPKGYPIVFLHGGPGGGCTADHRRFFDPQFYRVILFDQRGCGRSTPFAELKENTTWDLVADIEKLRKHLEIKKWHVFGGSWGSTLALAYAVTFPEVVTALILRGIFLCRKKELDWFYQEGASYIYPDTWETYYNYIPADERHDFITAYYKRLTSEDRKVQLEAARIWGQWEMSASYLIPKEAAVDEMEDPAKALPFARIESHYFINKAFFKTDNFLLESAHRIANIPGVIVQGRYDIVCPMTSAWELHKAWPKGELLISPDAGHAAGEVRNRSALIEATDRFRELAKI